MLSHSVAHEKPFGLRKRHSEKCQTEALRCCGEVTCNRPDAQSISHLRRGKELRSQLHLAGAFTSEAGKLLREANNVVILELSQGSRCGMRRQVFLRRAICRTQRLRPVFRSVHFRQDHPS